MSISAIIEKADLPSMWREFISSRESMQLSRDRVLQVIERIKAVPDYQTIASDEEKELVDETKAILEATIK